MLDSGLEIEQNRSELVTALSSTQPAQWSASQLSRLKGMAGNSKGVPLKLLFGSDFPYRETENRIPWRATDTGIRPSLALGGLSNVWGGAMLPTRQHDIPDWPIDVASLEPHFRAVTAISGLAAQKDDLESLFPLYCERPGTLPSSQQAELLLRNLNRHRKQLRHRGWTFGRSRLAVRGVGGLAGKPCVSCGFCMHGCPYGCIYNSATTVRELQSNPNFRYQRDFLVHSLNEQVDQVQVIGRHLATNEPLLSTGSRVYLAAGVIPTAQIVLRSQAAYNRPLSLRDSQYFLAPILMAQATPGVHQEALHTLSQAFIELHRPAISRYGIHLQAYTYSDTIGEAIRQSLGPLSFLAPYLEQRMVIIQGYLHSDLSSSINMTLKGDPGGDFLELEANKNLATPAVVRSVVMEILSQAFRIRGLIVPPMLQIAEPGRGYHSGGSIPMKHSPGPFESDCLGRPHGWSRIHCVDASSLPSIPSTTITFTVMANAHRIGWEAAQL
jgi:choline dehydrogenase-like flavoprotein